MTANEIFTSLFWLVVIGYLTYLGWFTVEAVRRAHRRRGHVWRARTGRRPTAAPRRTARTTPSPAHPTMRVARPRRDPGA
jgi:hypothetical protein